MIKQDKPMMYLSYTNLTPGLKNVFGSLAHKQIIDVLRESFPNWKFFFQKHGDDYSFGFLVSTKKGTESLKVLGPSVSKKMKAVDYSIFIPDIVHDLNQYIELVFEGIGIATSNYNVLSSEILKMKEECKKELGL